MTITVADFRVRFPEFVDEVEYPDARINLFIGDSTVYIGTSESHWNGKYNLAQHYVTAHLLTIAENSAAGDSKSSAGTVTSKSAGGVSVSRSTVAKDRSALDDFYMSTIYGQYFISLRNTCFVGVLTANCL